MSDEIELLKLALESSQSNSTVKDFIYPLIITIFGAFIAHYSLKYQQYIDAQKQNLQAANKWVVIFQEAFSTLITIKGNYGDITSNPMERMTNIPYILISASKIEASIPELSFLVSSSKEKHSKAYRWRDLPRINSLKNNYNTLISMWSERNKISQEINFAVVKEYGKNGIAHINIEQVTSCVGEEIFLYYLDLTERLIKLTDAIIIELHDFISYFYESAEQCIDIFRVKHYGNILYYKASGAEPLKKHVEVNYQDLSYILQRPEQEIRTRYLTGYENIDYSVQEETNEITRNISRHKAKQALKEKYRYWWK